MSGKTFGVPLEDLLKQDVVKHPKLNLRVPFFVRQSIKCITRNGIDWEGIFRISGNKETVASLKDSIDKGHDYDFIRDRASAYDISSLFKQFLRELPEPVMGSDKYEKWIQAHGMGDNKTEQLTFMKTLVDQLPTTHRNLLAMLIPFLARIGVNAHINKMDSGNLSKTVGPNLLWKAGKTDSVEYLVNSSKINDLVQILIDESDYFFKDSLDEHAAFAVFHNKLFGHTKSIQCLVSGYHDNEIWSCDSQGSIRIWDTNTNKVIKEFDSKQGRLFTMSRVGVRQIWTASQSCTKMWDTKTHECLKEVVGFGYSMARVGTDSVWLGVEDKINIYNIKELDVIGNIEVKQNVVMCMCVDETNSYVWAGTTDRKNFIYIWSSKTNELVKQINIGHSKKVNAFAIAANLIWSAGDDSAICVWDAKNFNLIKKLEGHNGAVYGLATFGDFVWSCGWDTTIRIWDSKHMVQVCEMKDYHNDCVSQLQAVWSSQKQYWQAWTASWDKSICTFIISSVHNMAPPKVTANGSFIGMSGVMTNSAKELPLPNQPKPVNQENNNEANAEKAPEEVQPSQAAEPPVDGVGRITLDEDQILAKRHEIEEKRKHIEEMKRQIEAKKVELEKRKAELTRTESTVSVNSADGEDTGEVEENGGPIPDRSFF